MLKNHQLGREKRIEIMKNKKIQATKKKIILFDSTRTKTPTSTGNINHNLVLNLMSLEIKKLIIIL